jgi:dTDP-4-dehydrorhamnose reductase
MKKVLLLGSSGMAGQILKIELLKRKDEIKLVDIARSTKISSPSILLDITNFDKLEEIILLNDFDFIINCVGILNSCAENRPDQAILINSYLPHFLEQLTFELNTKVIHISTDCVFSGRLGGYTEVDLVDGSGFYAKSKALGEILNKKDLTIRTSIIGPDLNESGIGLFNWVLRQNGIINGYTNAFWSGVTTIQLAKFIIDIVLDKISFPSGLIHFVNNSKISKFDLLTVIKDIFKLNNLEIVQYNDYVVDKSLINTRGELEFNIPPYQDMILELKNWMFTNNYKVS